MTDIERLFDFAQSALDNQNWLAGMIEVDCDLGNFAVALASKEAHDNRHKIIHILAEVFPGVTAIRFLYDGYVTPLEDGKPCPECLGEEPERSTCTACCGFGLQTDSTGRSDALVVIEITKEGQTVHTQRYTVVGTPKSGTVRRLYQRPTSHSINGEDLTGFHSSYPETL